MFFNFLYDIVVIGQSLFSCFIYGVGSSLSCIANTSAGGEKAGRCACCLLVCAAVYYGGTRWIFFIVFSLVIVRMLPHTKPKAHPFIARPDYSHNHTVQS